MKYTSILVALVASCIFAANVAAQVTPAPSDKQHETTAEELELERKALALLGEVMGETPSLKLFENRVRLQAVAAELLWARDEERARELFNAAASDLASVTSSIDVDDPQYHNLTNTASQLRQQMLYAIAQHDPKLALDFLRATRQPLPVPSGANFRQPDQELMLEGQLAQQIAARDPQQALRLAEEILSRGLSGQLIPVLEQLRVRDPDGAARLAANIVKKLRTANFATDYEATNIASYLVFATRQPESTQTTNIVANQASARRLQLDEASRRELVGGMVNAALNSANEPRRSGNVGGLLSSVRQLMPEVERYLPAQAVAVRRRLEGSGRRTESGGAREEFRQLMETGTPDALVEAAAKATPEVRQQLFRAAAAKAAGEGNFERARQIINSNIEGARQREQLLKEIEQQLFWRAVSEGKIEQAQGSLARVKLPEERVGMLMQLAQVAAQRGNTQVAVNFLEEAWQSVGGHARTQSQLSLQLQLSRVYASLSPARSFEIVEASIMRLNDLVAAAAVLDGFGQDAFAQDELKGQEGYMWGALAAQCNDTLGALAKVDFDHARSAADRFQRLELRLSARLAIARGALAKEGERNNIDRNNLRRGRRNAPSMRVLN